MEPLFFISHNDDRLLSPNDIVLRRVVHSSRNITFFDTFPNNHYEFFGALSEKTLAI